MAFLVAIKIKIKEIVAQKVIKKEVSQLNTLLVEKLVTWAKEKERVDKLFQKR